MVSALELARRYANALDMLRAIHAFDAWLGEHWHDQCPAPATDPIATTKVGAAGAIAWHEEEDGVVGIVPELPGCFRVHYDALLPAFPPLRDVPGEFRDQDVVINASMQGEPQHPSRE